MVRKLIRNQQVVSSNPTGGSKNLVFTRVSCRQI
jgi:hypothetical protein